jgi:hypothetical protein
VQLHTALIFGHPAVSVVFQEGIVLIQPPVNRNAISSPPNPLRSHLAISVSFLTQTQLNLLQLLNGFSFPTFL